MTVGTSVGDRIQCRGRIVIFTTDQGTPMRLRPFLVPKDNPRHSQVPSTIQLPAFLMARWARRKGASRHLYRGAGGRSRDGYAADRNRSWGERSPWPATHTSLRKRRETSWLSGAAWLCCLSSQQS